MAIPHFVHPFVCEGHLGCSHLLAIVSYAAMNIGVHTSAPTSNYFRYTPRSAIGGSFGNSMFNFFKKLPDCFPEWLCYFTLSVGMCKRSNISTFFNSSVLITHHDLNLYLVPDGY